MKTKIFIGLVLSLFFLYGHGQIRTEDLNKDKKLNTDVLKKMPKKDIPIPTTKKVVIEDITEWLCPRKVLRGDREFDGHGPRIKSEVTLRIGEDQKTLWADIYFWAQETVHDFSTTEARWSKKVYDAPYGQLIRTIQSDKASRTTFISKPAGFQFLVPGQDLKGAVETFFDGATIAQAVLVAHGIPSPSLATSAEISGLVSSYMQGNTVMVVPPTEGTLVKFFHIVGDTGGPDISTDGNCKDDTRIEKIEFFPVKLEFLAEKS